MASGRGDSLRPVHRFIRQRPNPLPDEIILLSSCPSWLISVSGSRFGHGDKQITGGSPMGVLKQWLPYVLSGISAGGQYALIAVG